MQVVVSMPRQGVGEENAFPFATPMEMDAELGAEVTKQVEAVGSAAMAGEERVWETPTGFGKCLRRKVGCRAGCRGQKASSVQAHANRQ